ncbi:hypothetical protein NQ317_006965 [Molorchus minor]|uniref:Uncharacterized protein n=1 Tax=Molorchus minor TaxID=1323400 RepID=A0ABQ9JIH6_9CUCU|nr:hypothetical protein NQ317_006965 [Molorchus minor]
MEKKPRLLDYRNTQAVLGNLGTVDFLNEDKIQKQLQIRNETVSTGTICLFRRLNDFSKRKRASYDKNFAVVFFKDDDLWSEVTTAWLTDDKCSKLKKS